MKNVQKTDKSHLGKLIDEIKKGKFVIPDFQRDFEWNPWDVRDLIKSIFMDYFIGTLLLWKSNSHNYEVLSCNPIYGYNNNGNHEYIVLDGQQRLTALHYAFFQPDIPFPRRKSPILFFIRVNELLAENYEEAFFYWRKTSEYKEILNSKDRQFHEHLFPLGVMKGGSWEVGDWIKEYRDYWQKKWEDYDQIASGEQDEPLPAKEQIEHYLQNAQKFKEFMEELLDNYNISFIELDSNIEVGKVCDIFTHINSKGIRLDIFDLLNAILRPKEIKLKEMWEESSINLDFTDQKKMKIHVLQVMSILAQSYCSPKYLYYLVPDTIKIIKNQDGSKEPVILISDAQTFIEKWKEAVKAVEKTIKILKNPRDYGAITPEFVPYPSIIPAFAAIKRYQDKSDLKNKVESNEKIMKWYWASVFTERYSSAVESTSAKDFMDMKKWFENDDNQPEFLKDFYDNYQKINFKQVSQKGTALFNAIFNLFVINGARDWENFDLPEYDTLDAYHIVPQSWGRELNIGDEINSVLNRSPLSPNTNKKIIHSQLPNAYLKRMLENNDEEKVYQVLESHLISSKAVDILLKSTFTKEDYEEFLEERKKCILRVIKENIIGGNKVQKKSPKILDGQIERIELAIRKQIVAVLDNNGVKNPFKELITSNLQKKVEERIDKKLRDNPVLKITDFDKLLKRIEFLDLMDNYQIISNNKNWDKFESIYKNKDNLYQRFKQLGELRNSIRHSRGIEDYILFDGEAAITWFEGILGIK